MKYNQFSITEIELTHEQAIQLKIDCINAIENYGIGDFETRKTEIEIPTDEDDPIKIYVELQTFTEYDEYAAPFEPDIIERSVHNLRVQLVNKEGSEVKFNVLGEKYLNEFFKRFIDKTPICIEEEITKHFTI